jgi:hypothetical protein
MRRLSLLPVQFMVHSSNDLGSNAQGLMFITALFFSGHFDHPGDRDHYLPPGLTVILNR